MKTYHLQPPLSDEDVRQLRIGDRVYLSGTLYTARDAAHKRMIQALDRGEDIPVPLQGAVIYYVGPTPAPEGRPIGAAGPTTSYRMDSFAPRLYSLGLKATMGKGRRNQEVQQALREHGGVYLAATGGAGALLSQCITGARIIAYEDLGPEAVRELTVERFPAIVANDAHGGELYVEPRRSG
ncbi:MAG: FumA C-terminus/TtdB family hydratase beta subunit [Desulfohalobiaceae bacterium]|nr:FumA C-terminus/TtdB family hydratase beta subunit [Desulfohalobiaceae bacterium]